MPCPVVSGAKKGRNAAVQEASTSSQGGTGRPVQQAVTRTIVINQDVQVEDTVVQYEVSTPEKCPRTPRTDKYTRNPSQGSTVDRDRQNRPPFPSRSARRSSGGEDRHGRRQGGGGSRGIQPGPSHGHRTATTTVPKATGAAIRSTAGTAPAPSATTGTGDPLLPPRIASSRPGVS